MKQITFFLDFLSPYAYLAFKALPQALEGLSYGVRYQPVFLGGLLKAKQQLGPAEIPMKREWVYRQSQWLAQAQGVRLDLPAAHPFNPLGLLRLAVASDPDGNPNRYVCETLFRHVWEGGLDAADAQRLQALTAELAPARDPNSDEVRDQLKAHTEHAIAQGVFGVPSYAVDGKVLWGSDALPMLRDCVAGGAWFSGADWDKAAQLPSGIPSRKA
jgi:2-hydroxychromene-2-carboxylate isomerase